MNPSIIKYLLKLAQNSKEINKYTGNKQKTLDEALSGGEITKEHHDALLADDLNQITKLIKDEFCAEAQDVFTMTTHVKA